MRHGTAPAPSSAREPAGIDAGALGLPARLAEGVTRWIEGSEAVFLDVGSRLQDVHARVSTVRNGIGRSTEILATPEMAEMRAGLASAVESSRGIESLVARRVAALVDLQAAIAQAAEGGSSVKLVFRTLNYVVLIARAQIGGMASGQEELIPFASHVDELVGFGEEVGRFIEERVSVLRSALGASQAIEAQALKAGAQTPLTQGFLDLIELIAGQQSVDEARRSEAQEAFTGVWRAIGGVVMGLQAHDMARQRFEHTARNLALLQRLVADGSIEAEGEPLPEEMRVAAATRILTLEIAQLDDLALTYAAKMAALDGDLGVIGAELEACAAVLHRLLPGKGGNEGLAALEAQASRLRIGFRQGDERRSRLGASLARSVEATNALTDMTGKLDALERDLRLAGFNAAVRAAHVEGGDETIGYIASVIREQASRARDEADRVRSGIASATASTRCLSLDILPAVATAEAAIEAALDEASMRLSRAESDCAAVLGEAVSAAAGLSGDVATVRRMMGSHEEGHDLMRALSAAVAALAAGLPPSSPLPAPEAERLDRFLVGPYTMEEERAVFQRTLGPLPGAPAGSNVDADIGEPAAAPADDLDDIFF
ncbi:MULTISPECIES: hypothetical protein [unclassified Aureimonas]|uniref:hypothetical protein n=1 Tax=unclassified Aureimonas TaxID=2615206 RepID=UPI0006FCA0A7|nr:MULTISPECIES: hypothetical protein [unclassified Aureimonas]KQT69018.1 hypothetical protein ASG54_05010 [Aureimonas sp. Leaf460]KQT69252.1 hypothetical protein ASG62_17620 [Aureimonas sp. Leaf427]